MSQRLRVGILALQGAVQPHRVKLARLGADAVPVRDAAELAACRGLIVPGGESTTFLKLIHAYGLWQPLLDFAAEHPLWGVCAGSILMAEHVENPPQESLGVMPITVRRNAYGRQNESFIERFPLHLPGQAPQEQEGVFIRAPQVVALDPAVSVLAECRGQPVALAHGRHLVTTFHPELAESDALHRHFLALCSQEQMAVPASAARA
ncbi:MAG TPA: pyridoxal 5'-phosphate synthase glutaminase subunit PdxT [bacterium]|nr:pyridoxal 5'-phosphate synthase glutaminase subunit PdxT [bacterium]